MRFFSKRCLLAFCPDSNPFAFLQLFTCLLLVSCFQRRDLLGLLFTQLHQRGETKFWSDFVCVCFFPLAFSTVLGVAVDVFVYLLHCGGLSGVWALFDTWHGSSLFDSLPILKF